MDTAVSVILSLVAFIGKVLSHIYIVIGTKYGQFCIKRHSEEEEPLLQEDTSNEQEMYSPDRVVMEREPMIFEFTPSELN